MPTTLTLDATRTDVRIRTRAIGLLATLAHDLEIECRDASGTADRDAGTARVEVPVASMRVAGVVRGSRVDANVLSPHDRNEIERKIRGDVLAARSVTIDATLSGSTATLRVRAAAGECKTTCSVDRAADGDSETIRGRCSLSLRALGVREVKGPMGAFKVDDTVQVEFRAVFVAAPSSAVD